MHPLMAVPMYVARIEPCVCKSATKHITPKQGTYGHFHQTKVRTHETTDARTAPADLSRLSLGGSLVRVSPCQDCANSRACACSENKCDACESNQISEMPHAASEAPFIAGEVSFRQRASARFARSASPSKAPGKGWPTEARVMPPVESRGEPSKQGRLRVTPDAPPTGERTLTKWPCLRATCHTRDTCAAVPQKAERCKETQHLSFRMIISKQFEGLICCERQLVSRLFV